MKIKHTRHRDTIEFAAVKVMFDKFHDLWINTIPIHQKQQHTSHMLRAGIVDCIINWNTYALSPKPIIFKCQPEYFIITIVEYQAYKGPPNFGFYIEVTYLPIQNHPPLEYRYEVIY